jgi:hypothetical protein
MPHRLDTEEPSATQGQYSALASHRPRSMQPTRMRAVPPRAISTDHATIRFCLQPIRVSPRARVHPLRRGFVEAPAAQRLREQEIRSRRRAPATLRFLEAKSPAELRQLLAGKVVTVVRVARTLP